MNPTNELLTGYADAAALMLAAADDREALDAFLKTLTHTEAAALLISALEVGASLVNMGDRSPQHVAPRATLSRLISVTRELQDSENVG